MRTPSLRRHKASAQGIVTLNGRDVYLGLWPADKRKPPVDVQAAYDRAIAEWLANGRTLQASTAGTFCVSELILAFWNHVERHYRDREGNPTKEVENYKYSLRPLRQLYGALPANEFTPLKLKAVRKTMIDTGLCRSVINQRIGRIERMFKWAVSEELIAESVYRALATVPGLERGRTDARETEAIVPIADAVVDATLPHLTPQVAALVKIQRLTGARPGEVCAMRGCDLDMSGQVWLYRPAQHKTMHRGKTRVIAIGPKAQEVIRPFLKVDPKAFLFSPWDAIHHLRAVRRAARKSKVQPSQKCRKKRNPKRPPGERYRTRSYSQAILTACARHGITHWHPNQLRHGHATEVRRQFGLEAAQVALGHSAADVTQIYAERDLTLAVNVAQAIG